MDVCSADAITITAAGGRVLVDWSRCSDCGKCHAACGNGVFSLRKAVRDQLFASAAAQIGRHDKVVLSCRQSPHAQHAAYSAVTLACFNRMILVRLVAMGAKNIVLLKGECSTCGTPCEDIICKEIDTVVSIVSLGARETSISLADTFEAPRERNDAIGRNSKQENGKPASRREFFGLIKNRALASIGSGIHYFTESSVDNNKDILDAGNSNVSREAYLYDLKTIGGETLLGKMVTEGLVNVVAIDREKCRLCGICSRMCPNCAFTLDYETVKGREKATDIHMNNILCTGCGLCRISCPSKAITVRP
ncbi:4Fe-4S binding protein [Geobacter sp. FeAm09]|uniref:4Fe-4S binding protein n=1 Tax=Geobacter sp. FeAm09 TaxID=2597769 RepID=UPI00197AC76F|nr:4Fe-4S dicluster domain-containing protein [Geobacter sp. FeAm09]